MVKRLSACLGLALAACLSFFSMSALAEPLTSAYRIAYVLAEPQSVALQRMELTLAMWRTGSDSTDEALASNLRASSNHFVMASIGMEEIDSGEKVSLQPVALG
ncbi:hypothetical protein M3M50_10740 [Pseudomonas bijieensis]|uniref:hypothetical protein n=1 Tax=Pseudomonas bijieensis TaxID=2681983 RepID=UPI00201022D2|nr:hypothetical protein [Pseudomonas bijieensis]UQI33075.1 hypothetical protein M3M50_10740 [Pseudomonas bijieensis]